MGSFSSVCWLSGCSIDKGDRVAALILEQQSPGHYDRGPDQHYTPRGVFGRGEYDDYGWLVADPDQPEFESLLKALSGLNSEAESYEIYDAAKGLHQKLYKRLGSEKQWGVLRIALVKEEVLDRAVQVFLEGGVQEEIANLYRDFLAADRHLEQTLDEQERTGIATEGRPDAFSALWRAQEDLLKALLPFNTHPGLIAGEMLLDNSPSPPGSIAVEDALKSERWVEKFLEVGAFYQYHQRVLFRPVCQPLFDLGLNLPRYQERHWLNELSRLKLVETLESEEYRVDCRITLDGGRLEVVVNAWAWLYREVEGHELEGGLTPEAALEDRYRQVILEPTNPELVKSLLNSHYAAADPDWGFAKEYANRFNCDVSGEFTTKELKQYIYFYYSSLEKELGINQSIFDE